MKKILLFLLPVLMIACSESTTSTTTLDLNFTGEMLFDGANTLQAKAGTSVGDLAKDLNIDAEAIESIRVISAQVNVGDEEAQIVESLLLQVLSDHQNLSTIGTLNPVKEEGLLELSMAEETDVLKYLQDEGFTWVLDANIKTEDMIDLNLAGILNLEITYKTK